ncbi:MAG: translocation/assembly module TamB domain-containing protein [Pseudomonadota bacterium]
MVVVGLAASCALVVLLGLLAYLHTASGRRFLAEKLSAWVSQELLAELRIERIDVLANDRLVISGATLFDANKRAVLRVRGLTAQLDVLTLLANAVFDPALRIELSNVHVERLEIGLYRAETGGISLGQAFEPRSPISNRPPSSKSGKDLSIHLPQIAIDCVSARTDLSGLGQATAELRALRLSFGWSPELLSLGLASPDVRVLRALPLDGQARLFAQVRVPGTTDATLDGHVGALPIHASLKKTGDELLLSLSSASLEPEAMRTLVPAWPLLVPLHVQVDLSGRLAAMQVRAEAQAGLSHLDASGTVALSPSLKGELSVAGRGLDARLFAADLAQTALGVDAKVQFAFEPASHVDVTARLAKGDLFGAPLPETVLHAVYAGDQISGTATSSDPALPVSAEFDVSAQGALAFHARAQNLDLVALAPYGLRAQGQVDFDATGELARDRLAARFEARVRALQVSPLHAQAAVLRGKVQGLSTRLGQLAVEVEAEGTKLAVGPAEFPVWALESKGSFERQVLSIRAGPEAEPTLQASTTLTFGHGVSLSESQLEAELRGVKHRLNLKSARIASRVIELRELRWQIGAGSLAGSALISPTLKRAELEASGLEAATVLKTLGLDASAVRGRLDARLHFEERGRARQGELQGRFVDGALPALGAVHAEFSAKAADSEVEGQGTIDAPGLGQGKLSLRGALGKAPITLDSLAAMQGEVRLDVSDIELGEVSRRWLPAANFALSGRADGSLRLAKSDESGPATLSYELKTRDLGLRSKRSDGEGSLLHAELASHGEIGNNETGLQIELKDAAGAWISAHAEQRLGWPDLVHVLRSSSLALVLNTPLHAEITARPRSLELLGAANPLAVNGEVAANFSVTGTPKDPEIEGSLNATGFGTGSQPSGKLALTFDYSAAREQYSFAAQYAERRQGKFELSGGGHWGWLEHGFGRDWSARAEGRIEQVELGAIGELLGVPVSGEAAGHAVLSASSSEFEATAELGLTGLALERHSLGRGSVQLRVHQGLAQAKLNVAGSNATLELSSELGLCWDGGPCVDPQRGGSLEVHVRNYQLAALAPLLRSVASDIRGPVNGFLILGWDPADATGKRKTRLRADASVAGGSVILASGAGSIQCAELRALGGSDAILRLKLSGCAHSNRPNLWAKADVLWNGPLPQRVDAELRFSHVPVSFEGVVLGTATVDSKARPVQLTLDLAGDQRAVEVSIPALEFELPTEDDTRLVDLAEDPAIRVTDAGTPPVSQADADEKSPWSVSLRLGNAVSLRQPGMRVPVTGSLSQSPDGLLDGDIVFPEGGVIPQLGQLFRLKRGKVSFKHQSLKEGVLNIEASTRTVEGVVIDLYVSGTMEKPVIRLRSDPPRSENDIVALLLGVQASDTATSTGQQGQDLRGSATALAMNQLVRGSALAGLQFGAGQTHTGDSISTVSVRAGNTVWLEGRTVRSTTQRAANSGVQSSGVVDWRFARGFSLRTQLGNISGVEMRWSHRY